ncbi:MAG: helix-turn-helix domain-containing protein [Bacteroidetes bacterium]|jgi:excisionase family DNA binding protein|nr:helix-turn-helix domain-containing protein [Bacteroidota bacterium]
MELSDYNLKLETFHHLLHDQLMPWLPEHNSPPFYKAWQQYVYQHKGPYLMRLLKVYERNRRPLASDLSEEWEVISRAKLKPEICKLKTALLAQEVSDIKLFFYRDLIVHAFAQSLSYFELQLEQFSDVRRRFALCQLMRRLDDLYYNSHSLFRLQQTEDAVVMYLVHLCVVLFRERLIKHFHTELPTDSILLNKNLIQPDHLKDYPMHQLLNALYQGYHKNYLRLLAQNHKPYAALKQQLCSLEQELDSMLLKQDEVAEPAHEATSNPILPQQKSVGSKYQASEEVILPPLSTAEAAVALGLSVNGLRDKAKRGELPYFKIGRLMKFDRAAIEAYINSHRT